MQTIRSLFLVLLLSLMALPAVASRGGAHPAPDFTLPTSSGTATLHSLRGKVVLVDFWASWCTPCRASFPWMSRMLEKYGSQGLVIVAINVDKDRDKAKEFLEEHPAPFVVAFDPEGETAEAFNVQAMPSSFLIGPDGTIVYTHQGFRPDKAEAVERQIREALEP